MTTETKSQLKDIASMDVQELRAELKALRESEAYYRSIFDYAPISLEEGDYSDIKVFLDDLRAKGVQDFGGYFEEHPEALFECQQRLQLSKKPSCEDFVTIMSF